ncbi:hypothetical protein POSPLADRAFT_1040671 [Postia placenta MAD-698-R-SB12]|uniref:Uncharacterized protein n=1 Tax=Postia placenta MAD-698-R-SB12 TaxID=670580 RepID=A0A1X6MWB4_9APHY|nr:hypothetical protein POSPLADRAFT_1040671 [Postia placenta MAD-698-R-SB12]OSX60639.1 hypothetical protein POSPLADRAFT_1040671 [Postia placenta MAD-698-R-SB12]
MPLPALRVRRRATTRTIAWTAHPCPVARTRSRSHSIRSTWVRRVRATARNHRTAVIATTITFLFPTILIPTPTPAPAVHQLWVGIRHTGSCIRLQAHLGPECRLQGARAYRRSLDMARARLLRRDKCRPTRRTSLRRR